MKKIEKIIKNLPQKPGVYIFKDKNGRILYVGKAVNLKKRVGSHFRRNLNPPASPAGGPTPLSKGGNNVSGIDWIETDDEKQAFLLENELIKKYKPRYNIQWQDDKSYFWVMITDDDWPRVKITHKSTLKNPPQPSLKGGSNSPPLELAPHLMRGGVRGDFIGPFVNGRELRHLLRALRKIFPYRTCKNPYEKPCLQWHLELCPAHGISDKSQVISDKLKSYLNSLNALSQFLKLYADEPIRIEAYDISNIHGVWATGSMIVFYGNKPSKNDYRRFKIKTVRNSNDTAMIKEVLRRRFGHPEWPTPDLILIDGGRAQLHAARLSLVTRHLSLPIIALAKREEEIYTEYSDKTLKLSALQTELRLIFQAIRDEAHRFAIFYYRHLHRKHIRT